MAKKQISILVDEKILTEIDADVERMKRSRNWVIGMRLENSRTLPPLYRAGKDGSVEIIPGDGYGVSSAGVSVSKKIAEVSAGGAAQGDGGAPGLPRGGKAQDGGIGDDIDEADAEWWSNMRRSGRKFPDGVPCGHAGCLSHLSHPCEGCGRVGGRRPIYNMEDNEFEKNRGASVAAKFPHWTEDHLRKIAAEEPGGLMACSPDILSMMMEDAKIDAVTATKLHLAGVKLDREILVRWGLADNYKPQMEGVNGVEGQGAAGEDKRVDGRDIEAVAEAPDGAKGAARGNGKAGVDMDALRAICEGKGIHPVPLSAEPVEVDLCGFKSYNEEDGENYFCGKEKHGPKIKHGEWVKI